MIVELSLIFLGILAVVLATLSVGVLSEETEIKPKRRTMDEILGITAEEKTFDTPEKIEEIKKEIRDTYSTDPLRKFMYNLHKKMSGDDNFPPEFERKIDQLVKNYPTAKKWKDELVEGIPTNYLNPFNPDKTRMFDASNTPHYFHVNRLEIQNEKCEPEKVIDDALVIYAHGSRRNDRWIPGGGTRNYTVPELVSYIEESTGEKVDAAAMCHEYIDKAYDTDKIRENMPPHTTYIIGSNWNVRTEITEDGKINMSLRPDSGGKVIIGKDKYKR